MHGENSRAAGHSFSSSPWLRFAVPSWWGVIAVGPAATKIAPANQRYNDSDQSDRLSKRRTLGTFSNLQDSEERAGDTKQTTGYPIFNSVKLDVTVIRCLVWSGLFDVLAEFYHFTYTLLQKPHEIPNRDLRSLKREIPSDGHCLAQRAVHTIWGEIIILFSLFLSVTNAYFSTTFKFEIIITDWLFDLFSSFRMLYFVIIYKIFIYFNKIVNDLYTKN